MSQKNWTIDPETGLSFVRSGVREITTEQLRVVFQPIVAVDTRRTFAHEALVRCDVPMFQSPIALFEAATNEQCTGRLGRRIREVVVRDADGGPIFVNIHPEELSERWLVRPDDPLCLYEGEVFLEITEAAAFAYFELCMDVLREVRDRMGARLVIDDFGAGYSNLKRIVDLHPSVVKLDRSLVSGLDRERRQQILVKGLVDLCRQLGAKVVAEGVETVGELHACIDAGAQYVQGYLLARPSYPHPSVRWPAPPAPLG